MADNESGGGGSGWLGFLAGIIVVALIGFAIYAYTGNQQPQRTAQVDLNVPDVNINPPDVHLPAPPPAPTVPPQAQPAQPTSNP
ncbi:MAG TPA: hypothetical protein VHC73_01930 [Vitreimonas sp.]|jgi:hypothetical protein|nr:hypothetical protein [Vitreimonas sp.]